MRFLPELFANNKIWAARRVREDPQFFERLCAIQRPEHLWIGCADSRVPANEIVGLQPGELFVHRNVANIVRPDDHNCLSVVQYAVETLQVTHIMVVGHHRCGGVRAAMDAAATHEPLETWLSSIRELNARHESELAGLTEDERWDRMCELNVIANVHTLRDLPLIRDAWSRGQKLVIHGWVYDLRDGLLCDLEVSVDRPPGE